jgi:hypothetical protein
VRDENSVTSHTIELCNWRAKKIRFHVIFSLT